MTSIPSASAASFPAPGNEFVSMPEMSSLMSVIGLQELTRRANQLTITVYRPLAI